MSWDDGKGQTGKSLVQKPQAGHDLAKCSCVVLQVSYSKVLFMPKKGACAPKGVDNFLLVWAVALVKDVISSYKLCLI